MSVLAYHPGTGHNVVVTDEQLAHMRASGWMLQSEYEANQAAAAEREKAAADAAEKTASKAAPAAKTKEN